MNEAETGARLEAMEMRIAHQDRTIEELNAAVTAQWKRIEGLAALLERMTDRLARVEDNAPSGEPDSPPPHY